MEVIRFSIRTVLGLSRVIEVARVELSSSAGIGIGCDFGRCAEAECAGGVIVTVLVAIDEGDVGGVEEESEECVALLDTKVPFLVARLRSRDFRAASCSRLAASSFLARATGSSDRGFRLLGLMLIVRMTGAACIHRLVSICAAGRASRGNGGRQGSATYSLHGSHDWAGGINQ